MLAQLQRGVAAPKAAEKQPCGFRSAKARFCKLVEVRVFL